MFLKRFQTAVLAAYVFAVPVFAQAPTTEEDRVRVISDLAYVEGDAFVDPFHRLDLVLPEGEARATILWIHGGAWAAGVSEYDITLAQALADRGFAVAVMSYRLSPGRWMSEDLSETGVQHPAHIEDVASAFAWLWANADDYNLDRGRFFVSGFSAGGHLSALLAMDGRYLAAEGLSADNVRGSIPIAGTYDVEYYYEVIHDGMGADAARDHVIGVFGPRDGHAAASPETYLEGFDAPMLVIAEGQTALYTEPFEERVEAEPGVSQIEFAYFMEETHASLFLGMADREAEDAVRDTMIGFIERVLVQ